MIEPQEEAEEQQEELSSQLNIRIGNYTRFQMDSLIDFWGDSKGRIVQVAIDHFYQEMMEMVKRGESPKKRKRSVKKEAIEAIYEDNHQDRRSEN